MIGAATRVAAVIGHPIQHSLSPVLHNAGFASLGVDWVYTAFDVAPGQGAAAVAAMRTLGLGGLSVTMPHKQEIARAVDVLDPAARALDSVNTVSWRDDGALVGHNAVITTLNHDLDRVRRADLHPTPVRIGRERHHPARSDHS